MRAADFSFALRLGSFDNFLFLILKRPCKWV